MKEGNVRKRKLGKYIKWRRKGSECKQCKRKKGGGGIVEEREKKKRKEGRGGEMAREKRRCLMEK